jgi:hypothetical protein
MQDEFQPLTEYAPTWKRIDHKNPPKNRKMLFKSNHGAATIGVYYPECGWDWYCGLPRHSEEDKQWIREQYRSVSGRFADGKPYTETQ